MTLPLLVVLNNNVTVPLNPTTAQLALLDLLEPLEKTELMEKLVNLDCQVWMELPPTTLDTTSRAAFLALPVLPDPLVQMDLQDLLDPMDNPEPLDLLDKMVCPDLLDLKETLDRLELPETPEPLDNLDKTDKELLQSPDHLDLPDLLVQPVNLVPQELPHQPAHLDLKDLLDPLEPTETPVKMDNLEPLEDLVFLEPMLLTVLAHQELPLSLDTKKLLPQPAPQFPNMELLPLLPMAIVAVSSNKKGI